MPVIINIDNVDLRGIHLMNQKYVACGYAVNGPKDFYSIRDFYNHIKTPKYAPTTHRHFQVYLHPIIYEEGNIVNTNYRFGMLNNAQNNKIYMRESEDQGSFFEMWFRDNTHEQFSLAIQSIRFPTSFDLQKQVITTPLGNYNHVSNDSYYGKLNSSQITFTMIDQITPFLETKINEWIFEVYRTTKGDKAFYSGSVTPKVNIVIKYFRQDQVVPGKNISPNFIYYMTNAFPTKFQTCSIDHSGNDSEGDLRRSVTFNFDQLYVFNNAVFAQKFGLGYLFDKVQI